MPRKQTQKENILQYLKAGNSITGLEALTMFGCFRLPDIIYKLKADGHAFTKETVQDGDKSFASYALEIKEPEQKGLF